LSLIPTGDFASAANRAAMISLREPQEIMRACENGSPAPRNEVARNASQLGQDHRRSQCARGATRRPLETTYALSGRIPVTQWRHRSRPRWRFLSAREAYVALARTVVAQAQQADVCVRVSQFPRERRRTGALFRAMSINRRIASDKVGLSGCLSAHDSTSDRT
jgi:hypothetical protein